MIAWPTGDSLRDLVVGGVGLGRTDDLVDVHLAGLGVLELDLAAERDLVALLGRLDDRRVREDLR